MENVIPRPRLENNQILVDFLDRCWVLDHSQNLEDLWACMDEKDLADERIPYWAELWPSSLAMAMLLWRKREEIKGRICLDLGCGLGFTAIIGQYLGANVLACDYLFPALACARKNAQDNGLGENSPRFLGMDWRAPAFASGCAACLWAGDILYEKRAFEPVLAFLDHVLALAGKAWIGEPGRAIFAGFIELARDCGWQCEKELEQEVDAVYAGEPPAHVAIWRLARR